MTAIASISALIHNSRDYPMAIKRFIMAAAAVVMTMAAVYASPPRDCPVSERPKLMWVDLSANWKTFCNPDSVGYYVKKCKDAGFNTLIVDVKGTASAVAYPSEIAPVLKEWKGITRPDGYDYLAKFVDEGHKAGMKVYASFNVFCEGSGVFKRGILYGEASEWQSINYVPGKGLVPASEIEGKSGIFVNPALPQVQDYERSILVECATKYPVDGIMLDRARYDNIQSDFSQFSKKEFEKYIGKKVKHWPADIYEWVDNGDGKYDLKQGKYYKQWIEWRASVIYNFFRQTREDLKKARPDVSFAAYTGAWYPTYYEVGVNWASKDYDPSLDFDWATPRYRDYAYGDLIDLYTNGNYYRNVTLEEYRKSNGTYLNETDSKLSKGEHLCVEGACINSRNLLKGNAFCGGIYVEDYGYDVEQFKKAIRMNLKESDGLMVFDIVHIIKRDWWLPLTAAIAAQEAVMQQDRQ